MEALKQVLRYVMVKIGLRAQNWPQDEEKAILIEHIVSNFGGHRIDEIKLAFDMAIGRKLGLKNEEINCFENFTCEYFSRIMIAYRCWSEDAIRSVIKEDVTPQKIFTQQELDDSAREDVNRQYSLYLKGHKLKGIEFNIPILQKDGLLQNGETIIDFFTRMIEKGHPYIYVRP